MKKRKIFPRAGKTAICVCLCTAALWKGGTMAFFSVKDEKVNRFTTGNLTVGLKEPEWDPQKDDDGKDLYPGCTLYKNPTVKNITDASHGEEPCYVRMKVEILDKQGAKISDVEKLNLIYKTIYYDPEFKGDYTNTGGSVKLVQNQKPGYSLKELSGYSMVNPLWEKDTYRSGKASLVFNYKGKDGTGILKNGEESTLFTTIVIPTDWDNRQIQLVDGYRLDISVQAVQAQGINAPTDAWAAMDQLTGGADETDI